MGGEQGSNVIGRKTGSKETGAKAHVSSRQSFMGC